MRRQFKRTMTHSSACISYLLIRVVVRCSVLQCDVLQCVAVCCSVWQCVYKPLERACISYLPNHHGDMSTCILQHTARRCKTLQDDARHCDALQHTAPHCNSSLTPALNFITRSNTQQDNATKCETLQHAASHLEVAVLTPALDLTIRSKP